MLEFQGRRRAKSFLYSKWVLLILLVVIAFLAHGTWKMYQRYGFTVVERSRAEAEAEELVLKRNHLDRSLAALATEAGLEKAVRSKFSVVREGEYVVTVINQVDQEQASTTTKKSWWQGWFD